MGDRWWVLVVGADAARWDQVRCCTHHPSPNTHHPYNFPVSQVSPQLSPELTKGLLNVARALAVATRNWSLYPPEHPAVQSSVERLCAGTRQSSLGSAFGIGVTPDTLLIDGVAPLQTEGPIAEAAALLHDRDLLHITFLGDVSYDGVTRLLRLLNVDAAERRRGGGPA